MVFMIILACLGGGLILFAFNLLAWGNSWDVVSILFIAGIILCCPLASKLINALKETINASNEIRDRQRAKDEIIKEKRNILKKEWAEKYEKEWEKVYNLRPQLVENSASYIQSIEGESENVLTLWLGYDQDGVCFTKELPASKDTISKVVDKMESIDDIEAMIESLKGRKLLNFINVPYEEIIYFDNRGEFSKESRVVSSGAGTSLFGAAVGGLLFGEVGSVVGAIASKTVDTQIITKDNRFVELKYYENNTIVTERFPYETRSVLVKAIPEKEYSMVQLSNPMKIETTPIISEKKEKTTIKDRLLSLNNLLEEGLISEEEYEEQKLRIINSL